MLGIYYSKMCNSLTSMSIYFTVIDKVTMLLCLLSDMLGDMHSLCDVLKTKSNANTNFSDKVSTSLANVLSRPP